MVAPTIVWTIIHFALNVVHGVLTDAQLEQNFVETNNPILSIVFRGLVAVLIMYPHVGFIQGVRLGIWSAETYPCEEYPCGYIPRK